MLCSHGKSDILLMHVDVNPKISQDITKTEETVMACVFGACCLCSIFLVFSLGGVVDSPGDRHICRWLPINTNQKPPPPDHQSLIFLIGFVVNVGQWYPLMLPS